MMPAAKFWSRSWLVLAGGLALLSLACASAPASEPNSTPAPPSAVTGATAEPPSVAQPEAPLNLPPVGAGVGDRVPAFAIQLADGSTVSSEELLAQSQPTFLFFFATW